VTVTSIRLQILVLAREALRAVAGDTPAPVRVLIECHGVRLEFQAEPDDLAGGQSGELGPLERAILGVATRRPQTAKRLAGLLDRPCNSHFRGGLRDLVRKGLLLHGPDGYSRPAQ
jgi:hypothetical protein